MFRKKVSLIWTVSFIVSGLVLAGQLEQPVAKREPVSDTYHGVKVVDPYRWLEAMDDSQVRSWVLDQDAYARQWVKDANGRETIRRKLEQINGIERVAMSFSVGNQLFYTHMRTGAGILSLWLKEGDGAPRQLLHNDSFAAGEVMKGFIPSPNGRYLAYTQGSPATRWVKVRILDLQTGKSLADELTGLNSRMVSIAWARDSQSLYYGRLKLPQKGKELTEDFDYLGLFHHRLGDVQAKDQKVKGSEGLNNWFYVDSLAGEGHHLVRIGRNDEVRTVSFRAEKNRKEGLSILFKLNQQINFIGDFQGKLFFHTNEQAERGRVIAVDPSKPDPAHWQEVVSQGAHTLIGAAMESGYLLLSYRIHARPALILRSPEGIQKEINIPSGGFFSLFPGAEGDGLVTVGSSSLVDPGSIYGLNVKTAQLKVLARTQTAHNPDDFVIRHEFYHSKDGTRVPIFIVEKKNERRDVPKPLFMYAYGAGNWSAFPWYQPHLVAWMEMGGRYALPACRGGGEYGARWHENGIKQQKQNGIDDYLAAAEYLIAQGYTSSKLLVGNGGSASGQLVSAALVQRPDLFGAFLIEWPAIDMLRFKLFPGGNYWVWGNGDPDIPADFEVLRRWSPYQNLAQEGCYPPTMLLLGEKDESTVPAHGYKFQAALQHAQACEAPILTRMIWEGGHYQYGNNQNQTVGTWTDILCFLVKALKMEAEIM